MRSPALLIAVSVAAATPVLAQTLSRNDSFHREDALKQGIERLKELQAQPDNKESTATVAGSTAYQKLAEALMTHPDMAAHNQALVAARQALQTALASGDPAITASARMHLELVQTTRYQKARSIPQLGELIDAWQSGANRSHGTNSDAQSAGATPSARAALRGLQDKPGN